MNARFLALLAILGSGPLAMLLIWPLVAEQVRLADVTLAVRTQPRSEVIVAGYLNNAKAEPFAIESLSIEEPGREPYRRLISLDADRKFELALGQPIPGTYRVAAWTRKANWGSALEERWLLLIAFALTEPLTAAPLSSPSSSQLRPSRSEPRHIQ